MNQYEEDESPNHYLVQNNSRGVPVGLRRQGGTFAVRQQVQLPNGQSSKQEIQLTGARRVRQPRRTTIREFNLFGRLKREVITEEMFEADFCESLEEMFA